MTEAAAIVAPIRIARVNLSRVIIGTAHDAGMGTGGGTDTDLAAIILESGSGYILLEDNQPIKLESA